MEYDSLEAYDKEIAKLAIKLKQVCYEKKIPMIAIFAVSNDRSSTEYHAEMVSSTMADKKLADDKISDVVNILNGFSTIPPTKPAELEFEI